MIPAPWDILECMRYFTSDKALYLDLAMIKPVPVTRVREESKRQFKPYDYTDRNFIETANATIRTVRCRQYFGVYA